MCLILKCNNDYIVLRSRGTKVLMETCSKRGIISKLRCILQALVSPFDNNQQNYVYFYAFTIIDF